jgi:hypothetical protein
MPGSQLRAIPGELRARGPSPRQTADRTTDKHAAADEQGARPHDDLGETLRVLSAALRFDGPRLRLVARDHHALVTLAHLLATARDVIGRELAYPQIRLTSPKSSAPNMHASVLVPESIRFPSPRRDRGSAWLSPITGALYR